jgi:transposase
VFNAGRRGFLSCRGNAPQGVRERAVRMVAEARPNYPPEWAAMKAVAQLGSVRSARHRFRNGSLQQGVWS